MKFADLPVGAKFRFYRRGTLLTKTSKGGYTTPGAQEQSSAPDVEVLPLEDSAPAGAPAAPKVDDVATLTKAIDELEQLQRAAGTKPDPEVRQALRRVVALARMRGG